jgi:hypothetical protein
MTYSWLSIGPSRDRQRARSEVSGGAVSLRLPLYRLLDAAERLFHVPLAGLEWPAQEAALGAFQQHGRNRVAEFV